MAAKSARKAGHDPSDERLVRLRVICVQPPDPKAHGAKFGVQDQKRNVHEGKVQPDGNFIFDVEVRARQDPATCRPNFLGPWTNGTPDRRFLYLAWRPIDPKRNPSGWNRRMKIHLSSITWEQVERASHKKSVLEASVQGTGKDGGPNCASVPLLGKGWAVRDIPDFRPVQPA